MKRTLLLLLAMTISFACAFILTGCDIGVDVHVQQGELKYELSEDGTFYTVKGIGTYKDDDIVIPSIYKDKPVTAIGSRAFASKSQIKSVIIPDSVTSIGDYAFYKNVLLDNVIIPEGVTSIGDCAFADCTSLANISIPNSITSIGSDIFTECDNLKYYIYDNAHYLGNEENHYVVLMGANHKFISSCDIMYGTKIIYNSAFNKCDNLIKLTIPKSVKTMGDFAFSHSNTRKEIYYNGTVDEWVEIDFSMDGNPLYMYDKFFIDNELLTQVNITTATKINDNAFDMYHYLKSVTIGDSVTSIGRYAFFDCFNITDVTIGNNVTAIGEDAFWGCGFKSITIPDSVTSIGIDAFRCSNALESINVGNGNKVYRSEGNCLIEKSTNTLIFGCKNSVIPDSVTSIGECAFIDCGLLTSLTIPEGVISIGERAFATCSGIESINVHAGNKVYRSEGNCLIEKSTNTLILGCKNSVIPDSVTSIGDDAFYRCYQLASITIPDSVTSIGEYAFYECINLTNVTIPNSVTSIGNCAFYECINLTNVTIPDSVTVIDYNAFSRCRDLTSVTIGAGVTTIKSGAFSDCESLESVYYKGSEEDWGKIYIDSGNVKLTNATTYFYSESEPELRSDGTDYNGNFWHYVDGEIVVWTKQN